MHECNEEGQKPIKRPKTKDLEHFYTVCTFEGQNNEVFNINNNNLLSSLATFSPGDRKRGNNECWP